ncbi:Sec20-domain-containing protein [Glomus cerebriforme]|uniref:Sec20-domain-containing protein n=1 Tax=Glomus cerebriforme TaxID=658196 RepID=A0A397TEB7_9GLOM|nr:Sec20-domain-containing protein [Glomus cerebriforme]
MAKISPEVHILFENLNKRQLELENNVTHLKNVIVLSTQQELAAEIRNGIKELGKWIEDVKQIAEEQEKEKDKQAILEMLRRNEEQFKQLQVSIRRAILTSKQNIEKEAKIEREMLLGRGHGKQEVFEMRRRNLTSEDALLHSASDVTESLRRTAQLMEQEIERSAYSAKILDESSRTLKTTFNEYRGFSSVVRSSKQLITKLEQSDWTDRLLILFGLFVFLLVVLYILKKRVWNTGFGWVSWFASWFI